MATETLTFPQNTDRHYSLPWNRTDFATLKSIIEEIEPNYTEEAPFTAPAKVHTVGAYNTSSAFMSIAWESDFEEWITTDGTIAEWSALRVITTAGGGGSSLTVTLEESGGNIATGRMVAGMV